MTEQELVGMLLLLLMDAPDRPPFPRKLILLSNWRAYYLAVYGCTAQLRTA